MVVNIFWDGVGEWYHARVRYGFDCFSVSHPDLKEIKRALKNFYKKDLSK